MLNTFKLLKKLVLHTHQPVDRAQIATEGPPHGRPQAALGMIGLRYHDVIEKLHFDANQVKLGIRCIMVI